MVQFLWKISLCRESDVMSAGQVMCSALTFSGTGAGSQIPFLQENCTTDLVGGYNAAGSELKY